MLRLLCLYPTEYLRGTNIRIINALIKINNVFYIYRSEFCQCHNYNAIHLQQVLVSNGACIEYIPLMAAALVPVLLIMSIRNLEWLSPCSLLANILLFSGFIMIWYYMFQDLPKIGEVKAFQDW